MAAAAFADVRAGWRYWRRARMAERERAEGVSALSQFGRVEEALPLAVSRLEWLPVGLPARVRVFLQGAEILSRTSGNCTSNPERAGEP